MRSINFNSQNPAFENHAFYATTDLTDIIRKASHMTDHNDRTKSLNNHLYHHHHYHHPYTHTPRLPHSVPFPVYQNQYHQCHQRLTNEMIASAAQLETVSGTLHKRPLRPFWEMSIPDIDAAVSCNTEPRSKNRRTISFIAILIICLAIVAVGLSALTYWIVTRNVHNNWDGTNARNDDTNNVAPANDLAKVEDDSGSRTVMGEFRITNRVFNDALTLWSRREFEILASEVIKSMDEVFLQSPLARVYNFTSVTGFSNSNSKTDPNGVTVALRISLNRALITSAQELGLTFVSALEHGHGRLPGGSLRVDIRTIKFTAISATLPPITLSNDEKSGYDYSASASPASSEESLLNNSLVSWSNWSEWSPCRGTNRKCDSGRIHSRIRKCIAENGDVVNSDYCRMNNGEQQELEIRDCRCDGDSDEDIATRANHHHDLPKSKFTVSDGNNHHNNTAIIADEVYRSAHIDQRDRPCTDCKENEICLMQAKAAVPFCAKMKDPGDPRGCGGWCSGHKELCRYVGSNTYQCVDDSECLSGEWQCANGLCIPETRRCDGHFNCFDMSDEMHCQCKDDEFHCGNKTSCLPLSRKCNGIIDCWDGEDEQNCTKLCSDDQYACNTGGQCIAMHEFCDSHKQCHDGSDEPDGCSDLCLTHERQCKNGRCVPTNEYCDGINNCGDNSDEIDCTSVLATDRDGTPKKDFGHFTINNRETSAPSVIHTQIQSLGTRLPLDTALSTQTTLVRPETVLPFANKRTVNKRQSAIKDKS